MKFRVFSRRWVQILVSQSILGAIVIFSAPLLGFSVISQRTLQIILAMVLISTFTAAYPLLARVRGFSQQWARILIFGALLTAIATEVVFETNNPFFIPLAITISSLIIPVAFVAYLYQHVQGVTVSLLWLVAAFLIGGPLSYIVVGFVEFSASQLFTLPGFFGVGLAEESVKLILPTILFVVLSSRHEIDGLLIGASAGMGFAMLETMGGAMDSLLSGGALGPVPLVLVYRSILSPATHAAWTGFVCAILWRQRERTGRWTGLPVVGAFCTAALLHAMWNLVASNYATVYITTPVSEQTPEQILVPAVELLAIAAAGLALVFWRYWKSRNVPGYSTLQPGNLIRFTGTR